MPNNKSIQHFQTFDELFEDTQRKVVGFGIKSETVLLGQVREFKKLKPVMKSHNVLFSKEIALNWLQEHYPRKNTSYYTCWRLIHLLDDNLHGNLTKWKVYFPDKRPMKTEAYIQTLNDYIQYLASCEYRKATVDFKRRCAQELLLYLEGEGIFSLKEWNHTVISTYTHSEHFINRKPGGVQAEFGRLRHFLDYLFEKQLIDKKLSDAVITYWIPQQRIVTTMSPESQEILLQPLENCQTNKRDKAIHLLALRCGLRKVDIFNLKFENIDLRNRRVNIIQSKTGVPFSRHIPNDALDALIDYVKNERRKSDSPYIFIHAYGPELPLSSSFSTAPHFKGVDESLKPAQYGLHILRRTNASELAKSGLEIHKVGKALGHTTMEHVDKYLSTDEEKMRACALEVGPFDYKGGLF